MILYKSSLVTLDYDPATDILSLDWPDVQDLYVPAVQSDVNELITNIKHYDVKKLLIDTSKARINLDNEQYQSFLESFARQLMETRLQKFARIGTTDPNRENIVEATKNAVSTPDTFQFQVFNTKEEALEWLME